MSNPFSYTGRYRDDVKKSVQECAELGLTGATVLITGATGLIGSCVADLLIECGASVFVAGRDEHRMHVRFRDHHKFVGFVQFDAIDPRPIERAFDYIVHCAGLAHPIAYAAEPVETILTTLRGTVALLDHVRAHGGRLIYISSSEVYGTRLGMVPYSESDYARVDPLDSRSCYPESKRCAENLCASYLSEYGIDFVVARPGHIYGPTITLSDSRAHAQFAKLAAAGEDIVMKSSGEQLRSYVHTIDCATAVAQIMVNGTSGEAYNVSSDQSFVSVRQMAEAFATAGGVRIVLEKPTAREAAGYNRMSCSALDGSRLEALGWAPSYNMLDGAKETVEVLREMAMWG